MKKLVAILLCVAMLLGTCALGEVMQFTVKDIVGTTDGQVAMDLRGFDAVLSFAIEGDRGGMQLSFDLNGTKTAGALLAMIGQQILLDIDAGDGQERAYYVDMNALFGVLGQQVDLSMIMESAQEAVTGDDSVNAELGEQFVSIFADCVSEGGPAEIDGVEYEMTVIDISAEQVEQAVEAVLAAMVKKGSFTQEKADAAMESIFAEGREYTIDGAFYDGEESDILDLKLYITIPNMSDPVSARLFCEVTKNDSDGRVFDINLSASNDGQEYGLNLVFDVSMLADTSWIPADIGNAVDILSLENLEESLNADAAAFAQSIAMSVMSAMYINQASAE